MSANATYVDSEVTLLGDGETAVNVPLTGDDQLGPLFENERALTGQSDLLANLILSYRNFDANVEASLAFNFTDDRIVLVGEDNQPNIVEKARTKLDFLFKYGFQLFGNEAKLELKIQNIFDDNIEWEQAGQLYERWDDGVRYSLGVSYDFR